MRSAKTCCAAARALPKAKPGRLSEEAATSLTASLRSQPRLFHSVERPDGGYFWAHEALLYASTREAGQAIAQLLKFQPFLGSMASDPSLRGLANTLCLTLRGANGAQASADRLRTPIRALANALAGSSPDRPTFFSWRDLMTSGSPESRQLRHIILIDPVLDFSRLQPGKLVSDTIRETARRLQLDRAHGVRIRLTGSVALKDDEFATLAQRVGLIACLAGGAIILMLWLAVRSLRLIAAILATMLAGLIAATGLGLALFERFNLISVAFIPLFVGMGMDFGIQFSVRYRAERACDRSLAQALVASGHVMGRSLTLAAIAIAAGFLAFAPTAYYGVSQLGVIAGLGMLAALALNLTLLPALIALLGAPAEPERRPSPGLRLLDRYILGHRRAVVGVATLAALASIAVLSRLHFDFNPMHLRSAEVESVATLLDLLRDPERSPYTLEMVRPSIAAADRLADSFRRSPSVYSARTLSAFIPTEQPAKLALIADAANLLDLTLNPLEVEPPPSDGEVVNALERAANELQETARANPAIRADSYRLAHELQQLAQAGRSARTRAARMLIPSFVTTLDRLRDMLAPTPISMRTLPQQILREWQMPDGRSRISVSPRGDSNSDSVLRQFVAAGLEIAPDATGAALYVQEYARAVVDAFIEAGVLSFVATSCLLFLALHRVRDVAVTMAPIVLTALLTLSTCVVIHQPINFANIIALPLLLGMGVAFHIYFVMSWRSGGSHLLTSSLARGIFFSSLATATGFGSLWASKHPGTATMGKLLMISLVWTLVSALIFQPALMGLTSPRSRAGAATS